MGFYCGRNIENVRWDVTNLCGRIYLSFEHGFNNFKMRRSIIY